MMPEIDFMVLCDYVRQDSGVLHIIAGGIDRLRVATVPAAQNVGIAARISLTRQECDRTHDMELIFQDEDGQRLVEIRAKFGAAYPANQPTSWPAYGTVALNVGLPLPKYGVYSIEVLINDTHKKTINLLAEKPPTSQIEADSHASEAN